MVVPGAERSGIKANASGERHIPQSVRPDGSLRKEIKIRPGYQPPEDVEVYKNPTAEAFKNRGRGGVPGAATPSEPEQFVVIDSASANKNAKRREARRRAKAAEAVNQDQKTAQDSRQNESPRIDEHKSDDGAPSKKVPESGCAIETTTSSTQPTKAHEVAGTEVEKDKQIRSLKKKLRQARELQSKKEAGKDLMPEQLHKVIKIQELTRQLSDLGVDDEGENGT